MGLWDILEDGGSQLVADVKYLTKYATDKLITVRDTFPDYTLHDRRHVKNVVCRMEELLGKHIDQVRPLEAAMLILAAYFHDIGMVYRPDEVPELLKEQEFRDYLDQNPSAFVRVAKAEDVPDDVILDYCRARHADRVSVHLYELDQDKLAWQGVNFVEALVTVCKSHNEPLAELRSERFETDFLDGCDLRLCAILLRAADLLDFDQTRSPRAVYEHLRLDEAEGSRKISRGEWAKHMASVGFVFPSERVSGYAIKLIARPREPRVENAIRKFLDVVEDELQGCRVLLDFCDPRWRTLTWPGRVDRRGIVSQGYRWGDYRFVLDRHAVLQLFMGDRLYANPYVFIRELLQNAIDACRLNVYMHDADPQSMEVHISAWEDSAGNYWFRVDDTGVGMDQHIIDNYFLGVGRSYYSSDELQAEILRKNTKDQKFMSISRFGIGVLSTFIVGDHVEVSTRRRKTDGRLAAPIRMSLNSLDDFFVLRDPPMPPSVFPGRDRDEFDYRKTCGTSVAVRINPAKSDVALDKLLEYAEECLFYPPAKVFVNGAEWHERQYEDLSRPLLPAPVSCEILDQMQFGGYSEPTANFLAATDVRLTVLPLDLTNNSPSRHVRGQCLTASVVATCRSGEDPRSILPMLSSLSKDSLSADLAAKLSTCLDSRRCAISFAGGEVHVVVSFTCENFTPQISEWLDRGRDIDARRLIEELFGDESTFDEWVETANVEEGDRITLRKRYRLDWAELVGDTVAAHLSVQWLGHNGIRVSTTPDSTSSYWSRPMGALSENMVIGPVCLFDELRPEVSVSRDVLRDIPYSVRSALHLALRRAVDQYCRLPYEDVVAKIRECQVFSMCHFGEVTLQQILEDQQIEEWCKEKIFSLPSGLAEGRVDSEESLEFLDIEQLCDRVEEEREIEFYQVADVWPLESQGAAWSRNRGFYPTFRLAMLEARLNLKLDASVAIDLPDSDFLPERVYSRVRYKIGATPSQGRKLPEGLTLLPPFSAVCYDPSNLVVKPGFPVNLSNRLVFWLVEQWAVLGKVEYPAIFSQVRRAFAAVTSVNPSGEGPVQSVEETMVDSAELLNSALAKLRRSMKEPPEVLSCQVYADTENWLLLQR